MPTSRHTTVLRNTSGAACFFAFAGPRGAYLLPGEDVAVPGHIANLWADDPAMLAALWRALEAGTVEIIRGPAEVVYDADADAGLELVVDDGDVLLYDPDTGSYSGGGEDPLASTDLAWGVSALTWGVSQLTWS